MKKVSKFFKSLPKKIKDFHKKHPIPTTLGLIFLVSAVTAIAVTSC